MRRPGIGVALVGPLVLVAALSPSSPSLAGGAPSGTSTSGGQIAARGTEAPASAIPWDSVGPGWFVALWAPHAANEEFPPPPSWPRQVTTLYLVDPVGGRYRVARLPAPSYYGLLDWSGDGRRALIEVPPPGNRGAPEIEDLDLATGTVLHRFAGSADAGYQYTKPDGLAVLASSPPVDNGQGSVVRLGLSGSVELRYPTSFPGAGPLVPTLGGAGGVLPTLNGLELVVQLRDTMVLIANNGAFIRVVGPRRLGCSPDRWWDPDDLLASCQVPGPSSDGGTALWVVPIDGKAAYQLTYPAPPDLGDLDGWEVGTTVYTQAAGPCASEFLARRLPNGHMTAVAVPGSQGDVHVVGAHGSRLALQAVLGCGAGRTLFWFNPATSQEAPLLGAPLNGGSVLAVIPYPGLEP